MEDWEQYFWTFVDSMATEVEQFLQDVSLTVETVAEEIGDTITLIVNDLDEAIALEIEQLVRDWIEPFTEMDLTLEEILNEETSNSNPFTSASKIDPSPMNYSACVGCRHYHGQTYGDNFLVCGMHPYGWDDKTCPDWEG